MTDEGLRALASAGCGGKLASLTLSCAYFVFSERADVAQIQQLEQRHHSTWAQQSLHDDDLCVQRAHDSVAVESPGIIARVPPLLVVHILDELAPLSLPLILELVGPRADPATSETPRAEKR